ncbi:Ephrin type-A receptor 8 (Fragment) [Geodia barretti]|uniref:Ephrin type-A receptor 8 n=1 Tax=Geodia barretti TaxID=519541 RepID=A0AA35R1T0_GEOBA
MGQFRHPNIVQLLGVVTLAEQAMIVLEFLSRGDLGTFLVNRRPMPGSSVPQDTPFLLLRFCGDVASGMEYLERKAFVHRDLAARNILVSEDNRCKIGDFGLCRDLLDEDYYITKGGMIPWRWTAPEVLHYRKYSTASDVWSFGCLMYEIWSLGHAPFEKLSPQEVQVMLEKGERLAPPPGCPRGVYSLMIDCWHPEHSSRPSFLSLLKTLASSPSQLLSWSHEDTWGAGDAIILGASLQTGKQLYPELQLTYTQRSHQ